MEVWLADLCADEHGYAEADSQAYAEVIFGPQVLGHVFDDAPVRFPLLFARHRLL